MYRDNSAIKLICFLFFFCRTRCLRREETEGIDQARGRQRFFHILRRMETTALEFVDYYMKLFIMGVFCIGLFVCIVFIAVYNHIGQGAYNYIAFIQVLVPILLVLYLFFILGFAVYSLATLSFAIWTR